MTKKCVCKNSSEKSGHTISCESVLKGLFTTVNGEQFTASMSATGSGSDCESAEMNSEENIQKTLDHFLLTYKPQIVEETHTVTTSCDGCVNDLVLYYRLSISPTDSHLNDSRTSIVTNPLNNKYYTGQAVFYMVDDDLVTYNKNIMELFGCRTPTNTDLPLSLQVPDQFLESFIIKLYPYNNDFVQAVSLYNDSGDGLVSSIPKATYYITAKSGIFEPYSKAEIKFDNDNVLGKVRTVTFSK